MALTVAAAGKILLTGGYLVLFEENEGIVLAVDRRISCSLVVEPSSDLQILVHSRQFLTNYDFCWNLSDLVLTKLSNEDNKFVETTLRVCLDYLSRSGALSAATWKIDIDGDEAFYGQGRKTGLGSSACLVTSLTGVLCHHVLEFEAAKKVIYPLAQISHCLAQGKIGSGFDVAACCYGSHVYRRFDPSLIQLDSNVLAVVDPSALPRGDQAPLRLPDYIQVVLLDVQGGSESPSMAKRVLQWHREQDKTRRIHHWDDLVEVNSRTAQLLRTLPPQLEPSLVNQLATSTCDAWEQYPEAQALVQLAQALSLWRVHFKALGEAAGGVPIEPDVQTQLADATCTQPGVVASLVPGAGGYDALCCLHIRGVLPDLEKFWKQYGNQHGGALEAIPLSVVPYGQGLQVTRRESS